MRLASPHRRSSDTPRQPRRTDVCTVSVLRGPWSDPAKGVALPRWRVVFNRDERRTRTPGLPPIVADYRGVMATHPTDPDGEGTWLAATDAGLVFALLNETGGPSTPPVRPVTSRGLLIPALLPARSLDEVEDRLRGYHTDSHRPFRLLTVSDEAVLEVVRSYAGLRVMRHRVKSRLIRTSSSVEPADTRWRRTALFDRLVPKSSIAAQDRFHAHRWRLAPGASVLMARSDACTVSVTIVDVFAHRIRLAYRALPTGIDDVTELALAA